VQSEFQLAHFLRLDPAEYFNELVDPLFGHGDLFSFVDVEASSGNSGNEVLLDLLDDILEELKVGPRHMHETFDLAVTQKGEVTFLGRVMSAR
jgi:hypothetical protein